MNFVIILTDDQRWDSLWAMPILQDRLRSRGVNFTNAYVSTPWCCPSRASYLSGGYQPYNTMVVYNWLPGAGYNDYDTIATNLYVQGYRTGFIGKYMNGYPTLAPYVPPGWERFVAIAEQEESMDPFNYKVVEGQSDLNSSMGTIAQVSQYATDFQRDEAIAFLDGVGSEPFLLYVSTNATKISTGAPQDDGLFTNYTYNGRGYGETDLSDKPSWVTDWLSQKGDCRNSTHQQYWRKDLRSLQAVDRLVGAIYDKVEQLGKLNQTVFIFTSDQGIAWGEHGLCWKGLPYEEVTRVPFIMVVPGNTPKDVDELVVANLDLGATVYELAGLQGIADGMSLVPLIQGSATNWRSEFLIQSYNNYVWAGLRVKDQGGEWKYVEHPTGEKELYDLIADPFEEENLHNYFEYAPLIDKFSSRVNGLRGLSILLIQGQDLPLAVVGQYYSYKIPVWGGTGPLRFYNTYGNTPAGLTLGVYNGVISGVPTGVNSIDMFLRVNGNAMATHAGVQEKRYMKLGFHICSSAARIAGAIPAYYSTIQGTYDGVVDTGTIHILGAIVTENLSFDRPVSIRIENGYNDCNYSSNGGKTVVNGNLTISDGTVEMKSGKFELM